MYICNNFQKTQITLVLGGFRTNPEKCELFEFDFFSTKKFFFVEIQKVHIIFEIRTFHQICGRGPSLQAGSNGVFGLVWNLLEPKLFEF